MPFTNWIMKMEAHEQQELLDDMLSLMTDDQKAKLINDVADELHDKG